VGGQNLDLSKNTDTGGKAAMRSRGLRGAPLAPPVGSGTSPSNWQSGEKNLWDNILKFKMFIGEF
jgi:hypothetical protein